jgi:CheY-like chemotaxis protein
MKTVLIVEDNTTIRENISEILGLKGYAILTAVNGKTGLALAKEKRPDIILCDVMMPEMDGYNVFNSLKESPDTMNIPFIFITASADRKDIEKGLVVGADGYITKPFDGNELCAIIDRCLKAEASVWVKADTGN